MTSVSAGKGIAGNGSPLPKASRHQWMIRGTFWGFPSPRGAIGCHSTGRKPSCRRKSWVGHPKLSSQGVVKHRGVPQPNRQLRTCHSWTRLNILRSSSSILRSSSLGHLALAGHFPAPTAREGLLGRLEAPVLDARLGRTGGVRTA